MKAPVTSLQKCSLCFFWLTVDEVKCKITPFGSGFTVEIPDVSDFTVMDDDLVSAIRTFLNPYAEEMHHGH